MEEKVEKKALYNHFFINKAYGINLVKEYLINKKNVEPKVIENKIVFFNRDGFEITLLFADETLTKILSSDKPLIKPKKTEKKELVDFQPQLIPVTEERVHCAENYEKMVEQKESIIVLFNGSKKWYSRREALFYYEKLLDNATKLEDFESLHIIRNKLLQGQMIVDDSIN